MSPSGSLRAMLFVPGTSGDKLAKATRIGARALILDLEDSVPPSERHESRRRISELIASLGTARSAPLVYVRVNAPGSDALEEDLAAVVRPGLAGVVVPKVERPADLEQVDILLAGCERSSGLRRRSVEVMATVETAAGVHRVDEIAAVGGRLRRLCFGGGDFALDLGLDWPDEAGTPATVLAAKVALVLASRVAGLDAPHDSVYPRYRDLDGLAREAHEARRLGFSGKHVIHPDQIPVVEEAFRPTERQVARARRLVTAFEEAERAGQGAVGVDGELVDYPILYRARRVLSEADE